MDRQIVSLMPAPAGYRIVTVLHALNGWVWAESEPVVALAVMRDREGTWIEPVSYDGQGQFTPLGEQRAHRERTSLGYAIETFGPTVEWEMLMGMAGWAQLDLERVREMAQAVRSRAGGQG